MKSRNQYARLARRPGGPWLMVSLVTALIMIMVVPPGAQTFEGAAVTRRAAATAVNSTQLIELLVGRSTVLSVDRPITRVALSTPDIADALVTSTSQVLVHGKAPGTISLLVWDDRGTIDGYDVVVKRDLSSLEDQMRQLFPDEPIAIASNGTDVVVSGVVSSEYVVDKAAAVAVGYVESADNVVNLLRQPEGAASTQIMLRVRFAEVSRTAAQELGVTFFTDILGKDNWVGRVGTQQFAAPFFDTVSPNFETLSQNGDYNGGLRFSDYLNIFAFNAQEHLGAVIKAAEQRGLFQSLAEPNLIAQNGTEASFLAGGEFPYPVVQGTGAQGSVTIQFKEFGVRLRFTPTVVSGDRIRLNIEPEVSALDFRNAVTLDGFRIPALTTRRTRTEVELRDGQTFSVAGLLDNTATESVHKIPGLGDIPILGRLFRSRAYQKNRTELVVMVTPHIVREGGTGVTDSLPGMAQPFLEGVEAPLSPPPPAFTTSRPAGGIVARDGRDGASTPDPATSAPVARELKKAERTQLVEERRAAERQRKEDEKAARAAVEAERKRLEVEAKAARERLKTEQRAAEQQRKEDEKVARAAAEAERRRLEVEAKAERERLETERRVAERQRKEDEKRSEVERRWLEVEARAERQRLEAARKAAEHQRKEDEKEAREFEEAERKRLEVEAKAERKRLEAEAKAERKRLEVEAKAERKRLDAARKVAERQQKEDEQRSRARARAERERAEEARELAVARQRRVEKLARARAERLADLQEVLDEYLPRLNEAQEAVDAIDAEASELVNPEESQPVVPEASQLVIPLNADQRPGRH